VQPISRVRARPDDQGRSAQAGVIMLDMVLALAVLAMVVLLVLPSLPRGTTPARQAAYAQEIAAMLKSDRSSAARSGRDVATVVDVGERRIASGASGRSISLPRDLNLDVLASEICTLTPTMFAIGFAADGRSCGAVISLSRANRDWRVRVNWLTGLVDVVPPER